MYDNGSKNSLVIKDNLETRLALAGDARLLRLLEAKTPRFDCEGGEARVWCPACGHSERACAKVYVHECKGRHVKTVRTRKSGYVVRSTWPVEDEFKTAMWQHHDICCHPKQRNMCPFCSRPVSPGQPPSQARRGGLKVAPRTLHWCNGMDRVVWDLAGMLTLEDGILQRGTEPIAEDDLCFQGYSDVVDKARLRSSLVSARRRHAGVRVHAEEPCGWTDYRAMDLFVMLCDGVVIASVGYSHHASG